MTDQVRTNSHIMHKQSRTHTESENTRLVRVYTHIHSCPLIAHKMLGDHVHEEHDGIPRNISQNTIGSSIKKHARQINIFRHWVSSSSRGTAEAGAYLLRYGAVIIGRHMHDDSLPASQLLFILYLIHADVHIQDDLELHLPSYGRFRIFMGVLSTDTHLPFKKLFL